MPHGISVNPGLDIHPVQQAIEIMIKGREKLEEALAGTPTEESPDQDDDPAILEKLQLINGMIGGLPKPGRVPKAIRDGEAFHLLFHLLHPVVVPTLADTPVSPAHQATAMYLAHLILKELEDS